jgi:L-alanine-DL-glutamate epimerase-like enolase superfamily enzyme
MNGCARLQADSISNPVVFKDGRAALPDTPGLGIETLSCEAFIVTE